MTDNFLTFKIPIIKEEGEHHPLYNPIDYKIPKRFYRRHYVQRYYTKGRLHFLWDKITGKTPQAFLFWVEITFNNNELTQEFIKLLKSKPEVSTIATPKEYEF